MNIKLTKKEQEFLIDWLSDDFDLALKEFMNSSEVDFTPTLKNLKSIIKKLKQKLTKKQRSKNG